MTSNYDDLLSRTCAEADFVDGLTPSDSEKLLELLAGTAPFLPQAWRP
jgi:hypothetical protein